MAIKPRCKVNRDATPRRAYARIGEPQFEIAAWCEDDDAELPPSQVHFIIHWPVNMVLPPMAIRFLSPDTLGFFIEELTRYRRKVWPKAPKVQGE